MNGFIPSFTIPRARNMEIHFSVFGLWERVQPKVLDAMLKAYLYSRGSGATQEIIQAFGLSCFAKASQVTSSLNEFATLSAAHFEALCSSSCFLREEHRAKKWRRRDLNSRL